MQVKKIHFTNVFFFLIIMLVKYVLSDGISQAFLPFRFVDVIVITDHDLFQNDVIGLVLHENCKSKLVTVFIAWLSRCHDTICGHL
jgi:hypothetical protein